MNSLYLQISPTLSIKKLKAGIVDGPLIRKLIKDLNCTRTMTMLGALLSSFVKNLLGYHIYSDRCYGKVVQNMIVNFSHLDRFPENLSNFSKEQKERFHQNR